MRLRRDDDCPMRSLAVEREAPFGVSAAHALQGSIFEPLHVDGVMRLDRHHAHVTTTDETLHLTPPPLYSGIITPCLREVYGLSDPVENSIGLAASQYP